MKHTFQAHSTTPNFIFRCGVDGCAQTFRKFSAFSSHITRRHRGYDLDSACQDPPCIETMDTNDETTGCPEAGGELSTAEGSEPDSLTSEQPPRTLEEHHQVMQKSCASLLLTLKEKHGLQQTAIDFSIDQIRGLINCAIKDVQMKVESAIHSSGSVSALPDLSGCFKEVNPFEGLHSEYMQSKFYREHFDLIVSKN